MFIFNERHRSHSVEILTDESGMGWAADSLCMHNAFQVDCKVISPSQAVKLSKIANIFTAIVRRKAIFADYMQRLLGYARSFQED